MVEVTSHTLNVAFMIALGLWVLLYLGFLWALLIRPEEIEEDARARAAAYNPRTHARYRKRHLRVD